MNTHRPCARLIVAACMMGPMVASGACYQLFDKGNRLVLQSTTPPVDLSKPISEEVLRLYPGHALIIGPDGVCAELDELNSASKTLKLPAGNLDRGPVQLLAGSEALPSRSSTTSPSAPRPTWSSRPQSGALPPLAGRNSGSSSTTCHTGPRGGTYTITASGAKNYKGC